jgi:plasmid stabilization system protein ParE
MRVIYSEEALEDLDGILAYIASNYPTVYESFQNRLRSVVARIGEWPDSQSFSTFMSAARNICSIRPTSVDARVVVRFS